jgi:hypothetical protein
MVSGSVVKMLASTIQFTRYQPTNQNPPASHGQAPKGGSEKITSDQPTPVPKDQSLAAGLISQSSTVCQDPSASPPTPGSTPHQHSEEQQAQQY